MIDKKEQLAIKDSSSLIFVYSQNSLSGEISKLQRAFLDVPIPDPNFGRLATRLQI